MSFIISDGLVKTYHIENVEVFALQGLNLAIRRGEMVGIVGASGSGKSTLMHIIGGLDKPTAGKIEVDGVNLQTLNGAAQDAYRSAKVGFVWQQGIRNLVPYLNAEENVILTAVLAGVSLAQAKTRASELLELVGLTRRRHHRLEELSGGEQQRVAIAVGLVNQPELLLADEPTGEVDSATSAGIFKLFQDLNKRYGMTIVIVSHDTSISKYVDRVVAIRDGRAVSETVRAQPVVEPGSEISSESSAAEARLEEVLLLDPAGRLQLPGEFLERLGMKDRVKVELRENGIFLLPAGQDAIPVMDASRGEAQSAGMTIYSEGASRDWGQPGTRKRKTEPPVKTGPRAAGILAKIGERARGWSWQLWLVVALVIVYLVPIWAFPYIPTQDGPSHLYNSQVLAWYLNPSSNFHQFYDLRLALFPNWLTYLILAPLMMVVPALVAEKILLSLYVILFPLSVWYLLDAIQPGRTLFTLASFGLIYNYLLLMGFYNFVFSVPLVLLMIGYWWKRRDSLGLREIILINLMCVLIWFGHIVGYAVALFAVGLLALLHIRAGVKPFLKTLLCILPSTALFFNYYLGSNITGFYKIDFDRVPGLALDLASMHVLVSYSEAQQVLAYAVTALYVLLFVTTIWMKLRGREKWYARFTRRDLILLLVLCLLVFYLLLPWSMGPGGWLNDRFALLISLLLLAWFVEGEHRLWRVGFAALAACIALANAAYLVSAFSYFNSGLREYTSGTGVIEKGRVILPIFFDSNGGSERVGVYVNAANYYALDNGGINLGNYEVQFDYFPIKFKDNFARPVDEDEWVQTIHWQPEKIDLCRYAPHIDYLETWGKATPLVLMDIRGCFSLIFENGRQRIYIPNGIE